MCNVMCSEGMSEEDESEIGVKGACENSSCPKCERVSRMGLSVCINEEELPRTLL